MDLTLQKNKKIKGATQVCDRGITFKSRLEQSCYKILIESSLPFAYEPEKIILFEGFYMSNVKYYAPENKTYRSNLVYKKDKIRSITYTPDFKISYKNYKIYVDVKGKENDVYPLKKKIFLKYLESKQDGYDYLFFEPHSVRQMKEMIDLIIEL